MNENVHFCAMPITRTKCRNSLFHCVQTTKDHHTSTAVIASQKVMWCLFLLLAFCGGAPTFPRYPREWNTTLEQYSFADPLKRGLVAAVGFTDNTEQYIFPTHTGNFTPACSEPAGAAGYEITFRTHAADQTRLVQWSDNGLRFRDAHRPRPHMLAMNNVDWTQDALVNGNSTVFTNWMLFRKPPEILNDPTSVTLAGIWGIHRETGQPFSPTSPSCPVNGTTIWPPQERSFTNTPSFECPTDPAARQALFYLKARFDDEEIIFTIVDCYSEVPRSTQLSDEKYFYDTAYQINIIWTPVEPGIEANIPLDVWLTTVAVVIAGPTSGPWLVGGIQPFRRSTHIQDDALFVDMQIQFARQQNTPSAATNLDFDLIWSETRVAWDAGLAKINDSDPLTKRCASPTVWRSTLPGNPTFNDWVGNCSTDLWDTYLAWTPDRQPACTSDVDVLVNQSSLLGDVTYEADWDVSNPHNANTGNAVPQNEVNVPARSSHTACATIRLWDHCEDYDVVQLTKASRQADIDPDEYTIIINIHNLPENGTLWNMCNTSHSDARQFTLDWRTGLHTFEPNQTFYYVPNSLTTFGVDIDEIVFFPRTFNSSSIANEDHLVIYSSWDVLPEQQAVDTANPGFTTSVVQALSRQVRGPNSTLHIDMDPIIPDVNANGTIVIGDVIYIPAGKCHLVQLAWHFPTNSSYNATIHISGQGLDQTFWNGSFPFMFESYEGCKTTNLSQVAPFAVYRDESQGPSWVVDIWIRLPIQTFEALQLGDHSPLFWIHAGWEHEGTLTANYTTHAGFLSPVFIEEDLAFPDRLCVNLATPPGILIDPIQDVDVHEWSIGPVEDDFDNDGENSAGPIVNYVEVMVAPRSPFGLHDPDDNLLIAGDLVSMDDLNATTVHLHLALYVDDQLSSLVGTTFRFELRIQTCGNVTDLSVQPDPFLVCVHSVTYGWQFGLAAEIRAPVIHAPLVWSVRNTWDPEWQNELETLVGEFRFGLEVPDFQPSDIVAFEFDFDAGLGDAVWFPLAVDANQSLVFTNFAGNPFEDVAMNGPKQWSTTYEIAELMLSQTEIQLAFGFPLREQFLTVWAGDEFGDFPDHEFSSPFICTTSTPPSTNTSFWLGTRGSFVGGNDLDDMVYPDVVLREDGQLRQSIFAWNIATAVLLTFPLIGIAFCLCGFAFVLDPIKFVAETTLPNISKRKNKNE